MKTRIVRGCLWLALASLALTLVAGPVGGSAALHRGAKARPPAVGGVDVPASPSRWVTPPRKSRKEVASLYRMPLAWTLPPCSSLRVAFASEPWPTEMKPGVTRLPSALTSRSVVPAPKFVPSRTAPPTVRVLESPAAPPPRKSERITPRGPDPLPTGPAPSLPPLFLSYMSLSPVACDCMGRLRSYTCVRRGP